MHGTQGDLRALAEERSKESVDDWRNIEHDGRTAESEKPTTNV